MESVKSLASMRTQVDRSLFSQLGRADETIERCYRRCVAEAGNVTQKLVALELERHGGDCPLCSTPFVKREILYTDAFFYVPGCHCYKKCPSCTMPAILDEDDGHVRYAEVPRYMVSERLMNVNQCGRCYVPTAPRRTREGPRHQRPSGKDAAADSMADEPDIRRV